MKRWFARMGVRDRLLLAVLVTVAVALVVMTVAFNLILSVVLDEDADKRLKAMVDDASLSITERGIELPNPAGDIKDLSSQVWVFFRGATVSGPDVDPAASVVANIQTPVGSRRAVAPGHARRYDLKRAGRRDHIQIPGAGLDRHEIGCVVRNRR